MKSKFTKYLIYAICTIVGFLLYVQFRTHLVPMLTNEKIDIEAEIKSMQSKLPMVLANSEITINKIEFSKENKLFFDIEFSKEPYEVLNEQDRLKKFNDTKLATSLCHNELVRYIVNNGGSFEAKMIVNAYNLHKVVKLNCLSDKQIREVLDANSKESQENQKK